MVEVINECMKEQDHNNDNCKKMLEYDCVFEKYTTNENNKLQSFISKYCHWYNEVNNFQATPIIDKHIKSALKCKTYDDVKKNINLINKNLKLENDLRIDLDKNIMLD